MCFVRIITVGWNKDQIKRNFDCIDKFEVGVEDIEETDQRKLCSVGVGSQRYECRLDVSSERYCDRRFGFWLTAVNLNHYRGVERVQSFANTIIDIHCNNKTNTTPEKVFSKSCNAIEPSWSSQPYIEQADQSLLRKVFSSV